MNGHTPMMRQGVCA